MKYLLVGLGNIGFEYEGTRHNIGFDILDHLAAIKEVTFKQDRLAYFAELAHRGRKVYLIKPTTYMNLSGKAVHFWMNKLDIPLKHVLVNVDDINLEFGRIRIRKQGSDGGHNGLKDIQSRIGTEYGRLRVGVGSEFSKGQQADYVLSKWSDEQNKKLPEIIAKAANANLDFVFRGFDYILNNYNS
ncbi:MAG: aminoacyl-tRNA hydrolase [Deltaproteobacteria bacterium]